jgi:hypothetical protein
MNGSIRLARSTFFKMPYIEISTVYNVHCTYVPFTDTHLGFISIRWQSAEKISLYIGAVLAAYKRFLCPISILRMESYDSAHIAFTHC